MSWGVYRPNPRSLIARPRSGPLATLTVAPPRNSELRTSLSNMTAGNVPTAGSNISVQLYARRAALNADYTGNPTVAVEVYETSDVATLGTLKATPISTTAVTSNTGQLLEGTFALSALSDASAGNLVLRVVGTGTAGTGVEIGALRALVEYTVVAVTPIRSVGMVGIRGAA